MDFTEISVDPKFHRHLIGKGGANSECSCFVVYSRNYVKTCILHKPIFSPLHLVNRIKEHHKVSVRIPPDNEKSNLIRIEGDPQGVQEAKKELLELASRMASWIDL